MLLQAKKCQRLPANQPKLEEIHRTDSPLEFSEGTNLADILIQSFYPPELQDSKCVSFKPPNLWYFAVVPLANSYGDLVYRWRQSYHLGIAEPDLLLQGAYRTSKPDCSGKRVHEIFCTLKLEMTTCPTPGVLVHGEEELSGVLGFCDIGCWNQA